MLLGRSSKTPRATRNARDSTHIAGWPRRFRLVLPAIWRRKR